MGASPSKPGYKHARNVDMAASPILTRSTSLPISALKADLVIAESTERKLENLAETEALISHGRLNRAKTLGGCEGEDLRARRTWPWPSQKIHEPKLKAVQEESSMTGRGEALDRSMSFGLAEVSAICSMPDPPLWRNRLQSDSYGALLRGRSFSTFDGSADGASESGLRWLLSPASFDLDSSPDSEKKKLLLCSSSRRRGHSFREAMVEEEERRDDGILALAAGGEEFFDPALMETFERALEASAEGCDWFGGGVSDSSASSSENNGSDRSSSSNVPTVSVSVSDDGEDDREEGEEGDSGWRPVLESFERRCPPGGEDKAVLYFTSLRAVRKTHEDCQSLRALLKGLRVHADERDVSMHRRFRTELTELMSNPTHTPPLVPVPVPRLFIRGRDLGGADQVRRLHEDGALTGLLHGIAAHACGAASCDGCGDTRFVPCLSCHGSRKLALYGVDRPRLCLDCNENGLIMCPICSQGEGGEYNGSAVAATAIIE